MSNDEKADEKVIPGHFESKLEEYPGFFELPHPFLDRHMKLWWQEAIEPLKKLSELDFAFYDGEWKAAVNLIEGHGQWAVEGVPVGDLNSDAVPSAVKSWVMEVAAAYIYPFLPLSIRRKLLGII